MAGVYVFECSCVLSSATPTSFMTAVMLSCCHDESRYSSYSEREGSAAVARLTHNHNQQDEGGEGEGGRAEEEIGLLAPEEPTKG